jgi:Pyruvate/2-oxoacid:ferredoxin oxidoreductase gamma subunit
MRDYFKDYGELVKATGGFYKKHWLGTIVMNVVVCGAIVAVAWPKEAKEEVMKGIKSKFKKGKKVES